MQRAQYTDLFESRLAYIDEILWENYDAPAPTYSQVFNMRTSDRGYEEITGVTGFSTCGPVTGVTKKLLV